MATGRFPPELLVHVLNSLDSSTLHSSSLVSHEFCSIAQDLIFHHLPLHGTLERQLAQCDFLLADKNDHLCSRVRKLTIDLDGLPVSKNETVPPQLLALLVKLGSQINTLCINGHLWNDFLGAFSMLWTNLSPIFCNCLYQHVMPSIKILQLPQMASVPLPTILWYTPLLFHIHLGTDHGSVFSFDFWESGQTFLQGEVESLSIDPFRGTDFGIDGPLATFIESNGGNVSKLHLGSCCFNSPFPSSFEFLSSCPIMAEHLVHFSMGDDLFDFIDLQGESDMSDFKNNLDEVAEYVYLDCSLDFSVPISEGNETLQSVFSSLQEQLPTWDQDGRLKLWIEM
ncbi:hypothetical protein DL96DRAFT_1564077 [Flagelloscypha sp. PMI_526]|nr:hypothetical protein DL96DRAFT_1564077 [Flagelloscypha sp. PMI_526]